MQLLVSVRSVAEARQALQGGCQILDIKEPARGALGMAGLETIREIVAVCGEGSPSMPVSVALGDAGDWAEPRGREVPFAKLPRVAYVKLGTQGLPRRDWQDLWLKALLRATGATGQQPGQTLETTAVSHAVILVAYADAAAVSAPPPDEALEAAAALGCAGLLIDTALKRGPGLFGCFPVDELLRLRQRATALRLSFGLAGRLSVADIPQLQAIGPDIVGIRSAACAAGDRNGTISPVAIRKFCQSLAGGRFITDAVDAS